MSGGADLFWQGVVGRRFSLATGRSGSAQAPEINQVWWPAQLQRAARVKQLTGERTLPMLLGPRELGSPLSLSTIPKNDNG
jgi:hypothetical protein